MLANAPASAGSISGQTTHLNLDCGIEFSAEPLPDRAAVTLAFRLLGGAADDPAELTGVTAIVERTLSKGTQRFDGRQLADAFDAIGAQWSTATGRQSLLVRVACLPEFVERAVELVAEMLCHPTFPEEACKVAVELSLQDLKHLEDDPDSVLRLMTQRLTLGPVYGRNVQGELETLPRITRETVRNRWKTAFHRGRLQVCAAGALQVEPLAALIERHLGKLGDAAQAGRDAARLEFTPGRVHRNKDLKQQYIAITLPGLRRGDADFAVEQVLLGVLSGGMSGRLFTEVREKLGLVYWVGAWHEQLRDTGVIHLGASTTPERCQQTFDTLLRELQRLGEDLSEREVKRARDQLIAHLETEADLTPARVAGLSEDLFYFSRPIGLVAKLDALRAVDLPRVVDYARRLPRTRLCVATLGPRELSQLG